MDVSGLLIGLIWLVLAIIVIGVVYWALTKMAAAAGAPPIVTTGIQVLCVLVIVIALVYWLAGVLPGHVGRVR